MPDLTTLEFVACAALLLLALLGLAGYIVLRATPQYEPDPEIPEKSGYLAEVARIDEERL